MTYFSDFESTEYYYNDEQLRKSILQQADDMYLEPSLETVPDDLFDELDLPYYIEAHNNAWLTAESIA